MARSHLNVVEFLADLSARGDRLSLRGDQLQYATRAAAPPAAVVQTIRAHRDTLIEWLRVHEQLPQVYPMSAGQQGLWMAWRLDPQTPIYNLYLVARLRDDVTPERVGELMQALAERHPVLRARFDWPEGGPPHQRVDDDFRFELERVDGTGWNEEQIRAWIEREADRPFDLEHGPVMRAALLETRVEGTPRRLLHWTVHHIVSDFLTQEVLIDDLEALVRADGAPDALELPGLSHRDFVRWEADSTPELDQTRSWWRARIAEWPPAAELPADLAPGDGPYRPGTVDFDLGTDLTATVRAFAKAQRVSVFQVLLAAYQAVLARYTGRERLVITTPTSLRHLAGWERTAGYMINPLCLALDISGAPSTLELLARTQATLSAAFEHQQFSFSEVLREIQSAGADMPAFGFILDATRQAARAPSLFAEVLAVGQRGAPEPVSLSMFDMGGDIGGAFTYDGRRFLPDTMRRLAEALRVALMGMAADPERYVSQVPLLDAAAYERILMDWSGRRAPAPAADHPQTLDTLFARQVARTPDAIALTELDDSGDGNTSITFAELDAWARALAWRLQTHGADRNTVIGVYANRSIAMVAALLAVHKAGAAYLPLDPSYPKARLEYMLADSGAPLLITTAAMRGEAPTATDVTVIEIGEAPDDSADSVPSAAGPDDLAYVIYTSGSTGRPKGVEALHGATLNRLAWMWRAMPFAADDVCCQKTALSFVDSIWEIFGPLLQGVPSVILSTRAVQDVPRFVETLAVHRVTRLVLVPSLLRAILADGTGTPLGARLPHLRHWICSGESLPVEVARAFGAQHAEARLINLYGSSEVAADVTWYDTGDLTPVGAQWPATVPIGRPIDGAWCYILDAARQPVPPGVEGELYVGGACLARGYRRRPTETAERFIGNPFAPGRLFRTGDRTRWLPSGAPDARPEIGFLGRADTQVKIRGFRVDLTEVSAALVALPAVRQAVVQLREASTGPTLVACVSTATRTDPSTLRAALSRVLPDYMVPGGFVILERMPLTPNGKIDLQALVRMPPDSASGRDAEPPATDTERAIAAVWSAVLGGAVLDRHDNFFLLGGHSLLATQVATRLGAELKRPVPLRAVFDHPTLAAFAAWIEMTAPASAASSVDGLPALAPRTRPVNPPLSFAQERLWVLDRFETTLTAYAVPLALRLCGPLDRGALEAALQMLVAGHAALRTTFPDNDGLPSQRVAERMAIPVAQHDLTAAARPDATLLGAIRASASQPFDLANGPLARATLFTLGEGEHALLVCLHHIIADGWSLGVLAQDLDAAYRAAAAGELWMPPAGSLDPIDYTLWQREAAETQTWQDWLAAWCRDLDGAPTVIELPTDRPRPAVQETACAAVNVALDSELTEALERLAEQHGASLFMVVLALWATLLARHGGGDNIVLGTPVANRHRPGLDGLVACLVNTVPLRIAVSGDASFADLLTTVRETALGAYERQDVPVEQVLNALRIDRSLSHAPLFQSIVTVEYAQSHPAARSYALGELDARWLDLGRVHTDMDLSLELIRADDGMAGWIDYATALFDAETVERLWARFETLARAAVATPTQTVGALPILPAAERAALLSLGAPKPLPADDSTIQGLIEAQAARTPEAIAVVEAAPGVAPDACRTMTYAELNARADRLARQLMALRPAGLGPQPASLDSAALRPHLIGICLGRSAKMLVAMLGVLKAGFAYVPVDSTWPPQRVAMILDDADPFAVITEPGLLDAAALADRAVVQIESAPAATADPAEITDPLAPSRPEDAAYIMYTSGSTGRPKGVVVEQRNVVSYTRGFVDRVGLDARDRALQHGTLAFDICIEEIVPPLSVGAAVVICIDPSGIEAIVDDAIRHRVTMVCTTPLLTQYFDSRADELHHIRFLASGGDVLHPEEVESLLARGIGVYNSFGPTETTVTATSHRVQHAAGPLPIGTPLANARAFVLDSHGAVLPPGVAGELHIGGGGVARGYLDRPELTAQRFVVWTGAEPKGERLYRTGDRARWRADGLLEFVGRMDRQVKIRGFRVELGEIEAVLLRHDAIEQVAVMTDHDAHQQKRLVAYIVAPRAERAALPTTLRTFLRDHLPVYMIPSAFVALERLPLTPTGKVDRKALPAPRETAAPQAMHRPRSVTEQEILTSWRSVLGTEAIDIFDNFFELGGHSLLAVRLMAQIGEAHGTTLPLQALFRYPTVAELAAHVDERTPDRAWSTLVALQPEGDRAPLFCVPGDGGNVFYFHPLARALGPDQPVYGLESLGLDGKATPHETVEDAAAYHIEQIKARWSDGPYHLAGHSFGGLIAFEMARQLHRAGDAVTLAVLDTLPPSMPLPMASEAELIVTFEGLFAEEYGAEATLTAEAMTPLSSEARLQALTRALQRIGALPAGADSEHVRTIFEVFRLNTQTVYRPEDPLPLAFDLILAGEAPETERAAMAAGWAELGASRVHLVPGSHTTMTYPPHVSALAERLKASLAR